MNQPNHPPVTAQEGMPQPVPRQFEGTVIHGTAAEGPQLPSQRNGENDQGHMSGQLGDTDLKQAKREQRAQAVLTARGQVEAALGKSDELDNLNTVADIRHYAEERLPELKAANEAKGKQVKDVLVERNSVERAFRTFKTDEEAKAKASSHARGLFESKENYDGDDVATPILEQAAAARKKAHKPTKPTGPHSPVKPPFNPPKASEAPQPKPDNRNSETGSKPAEPQTPSTPESNPQPQPQGEAAQPKPANKTDETSQPVPNPAPESQPAPQPESNPTQPDTGKPEAKSGQQPASESQPDQSQSTDPDQVNNQPPVPDAPSPMDYQTQPNTSPQQTLIAEYPFLSDDLNDFSRITYDDVKRAAEFRPAGYPAHAPTPGIFKTMSPNERQRVHENLKSYLEHEKDNLSPDQYGALARLTAQVDEARYYDKGHEELLEREAYAEAKWFAERQQKMDKEAAEYFKNRYQVAEAYSAAEYYRMADKKGRRKIAKLAFKQFENEPFALEALSDLGVFEGRHAQKLNKALLGHKEKVGKHLDSKFDYFQFEYKPLNDAMEKKFAREQSEVTYAEAKIDEINSQDHPFGGWFLRHQDQIKLMKQVGNNIPALEAIRDDPDTDRVTRFFIDFRIGRANDKTARTGRFSGR